MAHGKLRRTDCSETVLSDSSHVAGWPLSRYPSSPSLLNIETWLSQLLRNSSQAKDDTDRRSFWELFNVSPASTRECLFKELLGGDSNMFPAIPGFFVLPSFCCVQHQHRIFYLLLPYVTLLCMLPDFTLFYTLFDTLFYTLGYLILPYVTLVHLILSF